MGQIQGLSYARDVLYHQVSSGSMVIVLGTSSTFLFSDLIDLIQFIGASIYNSIVFLESNNFFDGCLFYDSWMQ